MNHVNVSSLIETITGEVKGVDGVRAIVLGGSRARGTHTPSSDIDLGIYYDPSSPLDLTALREVATGLDDEHRTDVITDIGGWGPWINGGGWLKVQSHAVDFLYRDLRKVTAVIEDCLRGRVDIFYQPGHPLGFVSSMYLGEVAVCQPCWDPEGIISKCKQRIVPFPEALQKGLIQRFAWEIDFSLAVAKKSVQRADLAYASGCCFRSVMCMLQVLFALNNQYWLNEKGALALADAFAHKPEKLKSRVEEAFQTLEADPASLRTAIAILEDLSEDVNLLLAGLK